MDINMPIKDGVETVKELRTSIIDLSKTRIIAASATDSKDFYSQEYSKLFDSFSKYFFLNLLVEKPMSKETLLRIMENL